MTPREANLSEAPAKCHLVKPKNPPKDIGFHWSRIDYHQVFILTLHFYVVNMRLSKEREDSIYVPIFVFFLEKSDLKLHVAGNR